MGLILAATSAVFIIYILMITLILVVFLALHSFGLGLLVFVCAFVALGNSCVPRFRDRIWPRVLRGLFRVQGLGIHSRGVEFRLERACAEDIRV